MKFNLQPYERTQNTEQVEVEAELQILNQQVKIKYILKDPLNKVLLKNNESKSRQKGLWKSTCFELFWKEKKSGKYWELNLASSLDWNIYFFDSYRSHVEREDSDLKILNSKRDLENQFFQCDFNFLGNPDDFLFSITAVIEFKNNEMSYWALAPNRNLKPDFHADFNFVVSWK